jgi:hypothetical protein
MKSNIVSMNNIEESNEVAFTVARTRLYYFKNGKEEDVLSAIKKVAWMGDNNARNLVEYCAVNYLIYDKKVKCSKCFYGFQCNTYCKVARKLI